MYLREGVVLLNLPSQVNDAQPFALNHEGDVVSIVSSGMGPHHASAQHMSDG